MDKLVAIPSNKKNPHNIELERTYRFFKKYIKLRPRSKHVLLDCKVSREPRGPNKLWEIELSFFHVMFRIGKLMIGTPFHGYFSCHRQNDFTTYSINIEGREVWFDQHELALASFSGDSPVAEQRHA